MSLSSENVIIGAALIDENSRAAAIESLSPHHFYYLKNQFIFHAVRSLFYAGNKVDIVIVTEECRKRFPDANIEPNDIIKLTESIVSIANIDLKAHIKRIKDAYLRRELSKIGNTIKQIADDTSVNSVEEVLNKAENLVFDVQSERKDISVYSPDDIASIALKRLEERRRDPRKIIGISTGMESLDAYTAGLQPSTITIVCGITGAGKSALLSQWACEIGIRQKIPSLLISTEMSIEPNSTRFIAYLSGVTYGAIQTGIYDNELDWEFISDAIKEIRDGKLHATDGESKDIYKICSIIRKYFLKDGVKIVFIDYLGEIEPDELSRKGESDYDTFGRWVQTLKHLASYLKIPIVIATQLNREAYDEHVSMKHIAGSFKIIQKSDLAIALEPKPVDFLADINESGNYYIKIIKQRNGPYPITFDVDFKKERLQFIEKGVINELESRARRRTHR